ARYGAGNDDIVHNHTAHDHDDSAAADDSTAADNSAAADDSTAADNSAAATDIRSDGTAADVHHWWKLLMEKMPYQPDLDAIVIEPTTPVVSTDWRQRLPFLCGTCVVMRELRRSDAMSLFAMLNSEEVSRFISPPPSTIDGFELFIDWTLRQRVAGAYVCFAVTLSDDDTAIGLFQVRQLEPGFGTAEWGFALGSAYWGTDLFQEAAELVLEFSFETIGVHRLEARAAVRNGRGNGALRKLGATQEGVLRKSFRKNGEYVDQALWTILDDEWRLRQSVWAGPVH
ncbi:MAG: hypothetical protein DMG01_23335, partial [Acidobacteria bacterium]